jgi:hypothetical protein
VSQPPPYRNQARSVGRSPGWLTRTPRATAPLLSAAGAARRALGVAAAAAAAGAKGRPASLTLAARAAAAGGWSSLEEACAAQAAAVGTAAARHGTESEQVRLGCHWHARCARKPRASQLTTTVFGWASWRS